MKINHILTESILFEQQLREDPIYKSFYSVGTLLVEKKLSQEEIRSIFKSVADGAAAGGNVDKAGDEPVSNRTLLGKGADVASTISKAFDDVKGKISQSSQISGFDVAFDNMQTKLLNAAGGEKGAIGKALAKYREFAIKHPVMQKAIYAGLVALAGISGAGLGGAAILGGIKVFDRLLQGDKASSALWSGFKTGAMAYGASKLGDYIRGSNQMEPANPDDFGASTANQTSGMRIAGEPVIPGQPLTDTQMSVMKMSIDSGNTYPPEIMAQYNAQLSGAGNAVAQGANAATDTGVSAADSLSPGEELATTGGTNTGGIAGQFDGGQYTVMKGDELGRIAQANGVGAEDIKALNPQINWAKPLQPGMNINLPPAGDNAGSVWQGYTGGTYGDNAANAGGVDQATLDSWRNRDIENAVGKAWSQQPDDNSWINGNSPDNVSQAAASAAKKGATDSVKQGFDKASQPPEEVPLELTPKGGATTRGLEPSSATPPKGVNFGDDYLKKVIAGEHPKAMISADDAQKALDWKAQNATSAPQLGGTTPGGGGFSKEYLEKVISGQHPRPMISVEKAKQLLGQSYVNPKPMLEYIDREATVRSWVLRESVGKPRGGVALTEAGRQAVFRAVVNEGPTWDAIKQGAGKFVKGMGQGFTNPGVRNIKNMDASQMAGAQVGAAGNKLATGYGKVAGAVQRGADAVGGVVKKGWDSATNKVTYDKLDLNWRKNYKEFDPTGGKGAVDSEVVADFLRKQGIKDGLISSVYGQLGIPFGGAQASQDQAQQGQQPQDQAQQGQQGQQPGQTNTGAQQKQPSGAKRKPGWFDTWGLGKEQSRVDKATLNTANRFTAQWMSMAKNNPNTTGQDLTNYASKLAGSQVQPFDGDPTNSDEVHNYIVQSIAQGEMARYTPSQPSQRTGATQPNTAAPAATTTPAATAPAATKPATTAAPAATKPAATTATTTTATAGSKFPGEDPQGPDYVGRREAARRQAARDAEAAKKPAAPLKFGPGVASQTSIAPSKVSYNINLPKSTPAAPAKKAVQTAGKINRGTPVSEQIDLAEVLWRKMKSSK